MSLSPLEAAHGPISNPNASEGSSMKNPERFNAFLSRVCLQKESASVILDYVRPPALPVSRAILFPPKAAPDSLNATQAINSRLNFRPVCSKQSEKRPTCDYFGTEHRRAHFIIVCATCGRLMQWGKTTQRIFSVCENCKRQARPKATSGRRKALP